MNYSELLKNLHVRYPNLNFHTGQDRLPFHGVKLSDELDVWCPVHGKSICTVEAALYKGAACRGCLKLADLVTVPPNKWLKNLSQAELQSKIDSHHGKDSIQLISLSHNPPDSARRKIVASCWRHGEFTADAKSLLSGKIGCPECGAEKLHLKLSRTNEEFIQGLPDSVKTKFDLSRVIYTGIKNKVIIGCPIHSWMEVTADNLKQGTGCKKCAGENVGARSRSVGLNSLLQVLKDVHSDNLSFHNLNYTGYHNDITLTCKTHGEFITTPNNVHLAGNRSPCPYCSGLAICTDDLNNELQGRFLPKDSLYIKAAGSTRDSIMIECKSCGEVMLARIQNLRLRDAIFCINCIKPSQLLGKTKRTSSPGKHFTYIVQINLISNAAIYKIGYTADIQKRLNHLGANKSLVRDYKLLHFKLFNNVAEAYIAEQRVLYKLRSHRLPDCKILKAGNTELLDVDPTETLNNLTL